MTYIVLHKQISHVAERAIIYAGLCSIYNLNLYAYETIRAKLGYPQTNRLPKSQRHIFDSVEQVLMAERQPKYCFLKSELDVFEIPNFKYVGCFWNLLLLLRTTHFQSWVESDSIRESCLAPGCTWRQPLTFDPWKFLLFFGSQKVDVSELLGRVGSFRCWPNSEVDPSCITITCQKEQHATVICGSFVLLHY